MQTAAALALAAGAVTGAAATAQASEQTSHRESASVQSLQWQGPFGTHSSCLTVQNEFQRYYDITIACKYFASSGYYFEYDNGN
ncbi:hypothetical protein GCM10010372_83160 [Streptomyces tauricus]|nr:hypothetical protein GCM10010372_83160 [Streptomyces tauricus]